MAMNSDDAYKAVRDAQKAGTPVNTAKLSNEEKKHVAAAEAKLGVKR